MRNEEPRLEWSPYDPNWVVVPSEALDQMPQEQRVLYDIFTFRNQARTSPLAFGQAFKTGIEPYPHVKFLSDRIAALIEDRLLLPDATPASNLLVTMPPRHGKSFLISEHTPPWYLSRYPNNRVILTSYEGDFAAQWGKKSKDLLIDTGPTFGLGVDPESKANARWDLQRPYKGGMQTAGTGGPITGKGGSLLIGDDWVKNSDDARSPAWRNSAWDWVLSTFLTRRQHRVNSITGEREQNAKVILLMTRWHEDDPVGRLLQQEPDLWYHVDIPALAREHDILRRQPEEALCPTMFTKEELEGTRKTLGTYWFEALYQGRPTPEGGGLFKGDKVGYWRDPSAQADLNEGAAYSNSYVLLSHTGITKYVARDTVKSFITIDLAATVKEHNDYTVFATWGYTPDNDLLLLSLFRDRLESADHLDALRNYVSQLRAANINPLFAGVEKVTYGITLIQNAVRANFISIRPLSADKDKWARAIPASNILEQGRFYVPRDSQFTGDFLHELLSFNNGAHDDQVDVTAYAAYVVDRLMPKSTRDRGTHRREPGRITHSIEDRLDDHVDRIIKNKRRALKQAKNIY